MRRAAALVVALALAGCAGGAPAPDATTAPPATSPAGPTPDPTASHPTTALPATPQVVASGLAAPWGLAFLPDGSALVTERDTGRVLRVRRDAPAASLGVVPGVAHGGEGGLLGVAVPPGAPWDGTVFVYATTTQDNRVLRLRLVGDVLVPDGVVLSGIPRARNHDGGRIAVGPDGYLYVATGDAGVPARAQDLGSLAGKILRVTVDGEPAPGNPFPGSPVWSRGHRNVQGLAWTPDGRLIASELGQNAWDELNVIRAGANYGWPEVEGRGGGDRFVDPVAVWSPSDASPSGIAVVDGAVYVAALRGEALWRVPLDGDTVGAPERLLHGAYGRLRAVEVDDEGALWLLTSNRSRGRPREGDDRVVVLTLDDVR
jgi:glucose/arabinose dehydrogenase